MRKRRLDEFMAGFNCISLRLKEMYQMITLGGDAELELVDSLDPFSEVCTTFCLPWKHLYTFVVECKMLHMYGHSVLMKHKSADYHLLDTAYSQVTC